MSAQRLLSCLLLLQAERRQTARRLAERLEVSTRTIYRDVEALSAAGVPVHMERGPHGGIVLADEYRRALAGFSNDELQALFVASSAPLAELGLATDGLALRKLAGALPASQRRAAEASRGKLLVDHDRWYKTDQPKSELAALRRATDETRRVRLRYRDRAGATTVRDLEPLGLVSKAGTWYLIAREAEKGLRTFRVERVSHVEVTPHVFARPPDFDLDASWRASIASIERTKESVFACVLRLRADVADRIVTHWGATVIASDDDAVEVRLRMPSADFAAYLVISLGAAVEIISPPELRELAIESARAALVRLQAERFPARSERAREKS